MKKLLILTLSILIILANVNIACAAYYSPAEDFTITEEGAVKYIGDDARVFIPPEIDGIKVTAIDYYGFYGNGSVIKVVVPDTVTSLGMYAFSNCSMLEDLELPMSIEYIGNGVIDDTKVLEDFESAKKEGYLQLGSCIFASYFPSSLEDIERETKLIIGNDVSAIAPDAFKDWKCMSFDIGRNVKFIGNDAFANSLLKAKKNVDNVLYEGKYALFAMVDEGQESVEIKPGTEVLAEGLFSHSSYDSPYNYNNYIKSVSFPKSITKIPADLFSGAWKIENISWYENIEEIGDNAFYQTNLGEFVLPYGLKTIGRSAFENAKLTKLYVFDQLERIDNYAFGNNRNLTDIYYTGTEEQWNAIKKTNPGFPSNVNIHYNCNPADFYNSMLPKNINKVTLIGGGTAVGRFFVRDTRGVPARNCGVKYTVDGKDAKFVYTDDEGFVKVQVDNVTETKDFQIDITSLVTVPLKETLSVTVKPATFKSSYEAVLTKGIGFGLSAGAGVTLGPVEFKATMGEIGAEGSLASGITFEQEYKDGKNKVSLTTKIDGELAGKAKVGLFAEANLKKAPTLSASLAELGGKAGVGISAGATIAIEDFDLNNQEDKSAIAEALLASILEATGSNVIARDLATKLNVKAQSYEIGNSVFLDGNASLGLFGVNQEGDVGELGVTLYGVNGKAVWGSNTKFLPDGNTEYESSFTNGSGNKVLEFELKTKGDSTVSGGSAFKATEKTVNDVTITALHNEYEHLQELSFTAKESEDEGVLWGVETNETSYTVKYPFENASGVSALNTYLSSFSRGRHPLLNSEQWQEVADIMLNNPARGEYSTGVATKKGLDIDLGFGAEAGVKISGKLGLSGIETLKYDAETGFIENGDIYIQGYNNVHYDLENRITIEDIAEVAGDIMAELIETLLDTASAVIEEKVEHIKSTLEPIGNSIKGRIVTISTPKESLFARNILLLSEEDDEFSTSSAVTTIGNPYIIEVEGEEEIQAKLTLAYSDEELADVNEERLSIVRWDDEKCVYVKVDSVVDKETNKVSATITEEGQYIISADTQPPAITQLYVNKNYASSPEIFAVVADVSGIEDFKLTLNEQTVVDMSNFDKYYDYSTGIFRYTLENYEENYYEGYIYACDTLGNNITTDLIGVVVDKYAVVPQKIIAPEKVIWGSEFKIESDNADKIYLCAEATDKNGKKYSRSFLAKEKDGIYYAKLEGIPAGLVADIWAEAYTYNGNCGKTEKIQVKTAEVEIVFDEVLKGSVIVQCNNPAGIENIAKIHATVYDKDGIMIGMQTADACKEITFTKLPEGAVVKAFLWEGVKPLCKNAAVIN